MPFRQLKSFFKILIGVQYHPFPNFFFVIFTKYLAIYLLKCYNAKLKVCVKLLQKGDILYGFSGQNP